MKDLLIRILVGAVAASLVSGAILYFAFDQSLRGLETAVGSTNERISDNGQWIRELQSTVENRADRSDAKLDLIADRLSDASVSILGVQGQFAVYQKDFGREFARSLTTTRDIINLMSAKANLPADDLQQLTVLLARLDESEKYFANWTPLTPALFDTQSTQPKP